MIKLSLIQTSQNRRSELTRFVRSLNRQQNINFKQIQLIFIDQGDNEDIFTSLNPDIDFVYIKYHRCSLSHARNVGLEYVKGTYIGFPDDDCWYESDTLSKVLQEFGRGADGVIARGTDESGQLTNKFPLKYQRIKRYNHCGAISYTIFLIFCTNIKFDEDIGVGSKYRLSSGEETDFLLQTMAYGNTNIIYNPNILVHHPRSLPGNFKNVEIKQYEYARGWGYLLKKHHYPLYLVLKSFIRPCGGILLSMFQLNVKGIRHSYYILRGRVEGFSFRK